MIVFPPGRISKATRYVLLISLSSRALLLLIQFLSNIFIQDHNADAYKNKYYRALLNPLENSPNSTHHIRNDLNSVHLSIYRAISGLTNWDSQYFLEITLDGYGNNSHRHLAFFPIFPTLVSIVKRLIFLKWTASPDYALTLYSQDYILVALIGIGLNNFVLFPAAAIVLFNLTRKVVGKNDEYALQVVKWFCFNPASIFFSAYYSESLFATLGFTSMLLLETSIQKITLLNRKSRKLEESKSQIQLHFPCLLIIAFSSITRSNGLVLLGFVYFHILIQTGFVANTHTNLRFLLPSTRKLIHMIPILLTSTTIAIFPYVLFQLYSRNRICSSSSNEVDLRPHWCDNEMMLTHPYSWIQAKYWNVGIFRYYTMKQIPNFLLATPMTLLILLNAAKKISSKPLNQLPYYLHGIALTLFCVLTINVQVTTRIIASSCPILYWICADLAKSSTSTRYILIIYFGSYFVLGTILHSNFYPWT